MTNSVPLIALLFVSIVPLTMSGKVTDSMPADWAAAYNNAELFYSADDPSQQKMPEIGNGLLGTEIFSGTIFMSGVYSGNAAPRGSPTRARIIDPLRVGLINETTQIDRALNVRNAQYLERFTLLDNSTVEFRYYAHRQFTSALICDLVWLPAENSSSTSAVISIRTPDIPTDPTDSFQKGVSNTTSSNVTTWTAPTNGSEFPSPVVAAVAFYAAGTRHLELTKGVPFSFVATFRSSLDSQQPAVEALSDYNLIASKSNLSGSHIAQWDTLWKSGMEFNRFDMAQAFNSSLYSVLSSLNDNSMFSVSSSGLSGDSDGGHVTFGAETWVLPSILLLYPSLAKSIIQYRFNTRYGASVKASTGGWNGTEFPWESAASGFEVATGEQAAAGIHVNGDIVWSVRQYYYVTLDNHWLSTVGYPLVSGIADFFLSRIAFDTTSVAHVNNVNPPDSTFTNINDSVFTNYGASKALAFATEAAILVNQNPNPSWIRTSERIPLSIINQIHPIFDGYRGDKDSSNADVVLLGFPFDMSMNQTVRRNDLTYYYQKTNQNAPPMTWAMYAVGSIEVKDDANAKILLNQTLESLSEPYKTWVVKDNINNLHAAGSWLQLSMFGNTGIRIKPHALFINPVTMPEGCTYSRIRNLSFRGAVVSLTFTPDSMMLVVENSVAVSLTDIVSGKTIVITSTQLLSISKYELTVQVDPLPSTPQ